jgi:hypothetical protein
MNSFEPANFLDNRESRNHHIIVMRLGSGWAAVHCAEYADMGWGIDFEDTGIGRYATAAQAEVEAKEWAEEFELPYKGIVEPSR